MGRSAELLLIIALSSLVSPSRCHPNLLAEALLVLWPQQPPSGTERLPHFSAIDFLWHSDKGHKLFPMLSRVLYKLHRISKESTDTENRYFNIIMHTLRNQVSPGQVAQLVGASSRTPKGCGFDRWSEHTSRLWVRSPVRVNTGGNQSLPH